MSRALPLLLALLVLAAVPACRATQTSGTAQPPPEAPSEEPTPDDPDRENWLPDDCYRVETPTSPIAYDCDDGSSFTVRQAIDGATPEALLEAQWHEALSFLEIAGADIGETVDRTCVFGALDAPCLVVRATSAQATARYVLIAVDDGDNLLAVDCVDLSGTDSLHPVCARYIKVRQP
ncbi:MAG: hypothetical protein KDA24_10775 [Deltaproteobacteria bacterium]|nr:hypothetical protein [Deltaproteobacteria bacterium]